jgi:hypothetical protein
MGLPPQHAVRSNAFVELVIRLPLSKSNEKHEITARHGIFTIPCNPQMPVCGVNAESGSKMS